MGDSLRVGVLGVSEGGASVIEAVRQAPQAELVAVADRRREVAEREGQGLGVESFDDFRSFVLSSRLDAMLVSAPPFSCQEALRLAASQGIPVWRMPPLARTLADAVELVERFSAAGTPLVVGRPCHVPPDAPPDDLPGELSGHPGKVFLAHAHLVCRIDDDALDWRGDHERAGGGVLLDRGYPAIDLAVSHMGLPDVVTASTVRVPRPPHTRFRHDTEDVAAVLLQYRSEATASLTLCWMAAPAVWRMDLYGDQGTLTLETSRLTWWSRSGHELHHVPLEPENPYGASIDRFVETLAAGEKPPVSTLHAHLRTMAVIEAAYLSARTGEPEAPIRLFEMQGLDAQIV